MKIDVFIGTDSEYDRLRFERRRRLPLVPGQDAYFARAEDVILYKLLSPGYSRSRAAQYRDRDGG